MFLMSMFCFIFALKPSGVKDSLRMVSKPARKTVVLNYSAFSIYGNPSLTHYLCKSLSSALPNSETWQEQQSHSVHMIRP